MRIQYRRKRQGRTDYMLRLKLIKSGKPRLVIRRSNNNLTAQVIEYHPDGDKVLMSADSKKLSGWTGPTGNISASYQTGLSLGSKAKKAGIQDMILDIGLYASKKGSRIYAALKGVIDAGIKVPHSKDIFPTEDQVKGVKKSEKIIKDKTGVKNNG